MAKELKTSITFGGKIDSSLSKALRAAESKSAASSRKINKTFKGDTTSVASTMSAAFKKVAVTAMTIWTAAKAVARLKDFAKECITAAKAQIEVETKLQSVLENVKSINIRGPDAAQEAATKLKGVASEIQNIGVIGDEVTIAGMQQLATFQLDDSQITTLSTGMTDLLAQQKGLNATQGDAVKISNMIGKAMMGQTGALSKCGISFTEAQAAAIKNGDANKRAAVIAQVLKENVGGVNKALAETDQGRLQQAENVIGDMQEQIGMKLLPVIADLTSKALPLVIQGFDYIGQTAERILPPVQNLAEGILNAVAGKIRDIKKAFQENQDKISGFVGTVTGFAGSIVNVAIAVGPTIEAIGGIIVASVLPALQGFMKFATEIFDFIASNWSTIGPVVLGIGTALGAVKMVKFARDVVVATKALALSKAAKLQDIAVTGILHAMCLKDTIARGAQTVALGAQTVAMGIWNGVCTVASAVTTALGAAFTFLTSPIGIIIIAITAVIAIIVLLVRNFDRVKATVLAFGQKCMATIQGIAGRFPIIGAAVSTFTSAFSSKMAAIKAIFASVRAFFASVGTAIGSIFRKIGSIASSVVGKISGVFNGLKSSIGGVVGKVTGLVDKIKNIKLPKIKIPGFANGDTVTSPTLAWVGEGKYPETIIPHVNNARSRGLLATAAEGMGVKQFGGNRTVTKYYTFSPAINATSGDINWNDIFERFKQFIEENDEEEAREVFA